jgi:thiamine-phosphate pyrophosphorylase
VSTVRSGDERRRRLERARLYLVLDLEAVASVLADALEAGVDLVQLRDKAASDDALSAAGGHMRELCARHGALFLVNDRPDLALALDADGCHVGQADASPEAVRAELGPERLIGLSTHSPEQFDAGLHTEANYLSAGPVHATPTKPGRAATGLALIEHAVAHATKPFFAIGGIDAETIVPALAAGAQRVVVVRAIRDAADPGAAAAELRSAIESAERNEAEAHAR